MNSKTTANVILCFASATLTLTACTNRMIHHDLVPDVVQTAFATKYVDIKVEKWERDSNGNWEAKFFDNGLSYRADFSPSGNWIETESNLEFEELPKAIREAVNKNFPNEVISEIEKVDSASKGEFYDVEFKRDGPNEDVEFRENGERVN